MLMEKYSFNHYLQFSQLMKKPYTYALVNQVYPTILFCSVSIWSAQKVVQKVVRKVLRKLN